MKRLTLLLLLVAVIATTAPAQNWPQFRGPGATGVLESPGQPVKWDAAASQNVLWKLAIPGLAHSSPVVWGNKVFVTTAVNSAKDETRYGLYGDVARRRRGDGRLGFGLLFLPPVDFLIRRHILQDTIIAAVDDVHASFFVDRDAVWKVQLSL